MKFKEKVAIVTGAAQGLGKEISSQLAEQGAQVVLIDINEDALHSVKEQVGKNIELFVCDISDLQQVKRTVKEIYKIHKNIDILVNNAGIWTDDNIEKQHPERRNQALMTNILGHIQITEELLPKFKQQNSGIIFNTISTAAVADIPSGNNTLWKTYGASKWGMAGYTHALRESLRQTKIKVIQYFPGGFDSNLYENAGRPDPHNQPWMMDTKEVADIAVFALSRPDDVYMEKIVVSKSK